MLRTYECKWGSHRFSVELDPMKWTKDWGEGSQAQCEVIIGHWLAIREGRKPRRYELPPCRLESEKVGFTHMKYSGGSVWFRDVELCPAPPAEVRRGLTIGEAPVMEWIPAVNWAPVAGGLQVMPHPVGDLNEAALGEALVRMRRRAIRVPEDE